MAMIDSIKNIFSKKEGIAIVRKNYHQKSGTEEVDQSRSGLMQWYSQVYKGIPLVYAIVNVQCDQVVQNFYFEGENVEKLKKWAELVNLNRFFHNLCKSMLIYGDAFVEVIKEGDQIVKLKMLNPEWIEAYRDKYGKSIGYAQIIEDRKVTLWGTTGDERQDMDFSKIVKKIDSIAHFKFNIIGSEKYGLSVIEPLRLSIISKKSMESNLGTLLNKYIAPLIWAKVGSNEMPAQDTVVSEIASTLRDLHAESEIVTSHLVELSVLDFSSKGMDIKTPLSHIEQQIITGGQVPPLLLGMESSGTDKSADVQLRSLGRRIKYIQREIKIEFEDKILKEQMGMDDKLIWESAEEREWESNVDMLRGLVTDGILTPQKANDLLPPRYQEKLPEIPNPLNQQAVGPDGVQIPRPNQMSNNKVKDNPTDPRKTTQNPKSKGRRIEKSDKE